MIILLRVFWTNTILKRYLYFRIRKFIFQSVFSEIFISKTFVSIYGYCSVTQMALCCFPINVNVNSFLKNQVLRCPFDCWLCICTTHLRVEYIYMSACVLKTILFTRVKLRYKMRVNYFLIQRNVFIRFVLTPHD